MKLLRRRPSRGFDAEMETIRNDAAEQAYGTWRFKAIRKARKAQDLFERE